jgi:hypothetical protein
MVITSKEVNTLKSLSKRMPPGFKKVATYIESLTFEDTPNYINLINTL